MRHARIAAVATFCLLCSAGASAMELDRFLGEIDVRASADLGSFRADLSATFNVSSREVDELFRIYDRPADVYITLRIGELSGAPIDRVVDRYRKHKGHGWGVIAKSLGIKPGSADFHALKKGRLGAHGESHHKVKHGKGRGDKRK